jgi:hypothetical protein
VNLDTSARHSSAFDPDEVKKTTDALFEAKGADPIAN